MSMSRHYLLGMIMVLLGAVCLMPSVAYAADADEYLAPNGPLPTADSPARGTWSYMRPASHEATGAGATEQCNRNRTAGLIALTAQQCEEMGNRFDAGEGRVVGVPDGIVFNLNNGRRNGVSYTTELVEKQTGRIDRAELLFAGTDQWGNRYYAYFFRGEDTSCNNIVWVILPPEPAEVQLIVREAPPPAPRIVCRLVKVDETAPSTSLQFVPGFLLPSCCPTCVGPTYVSPLLFQTEQGGGATYRRVCEPEGE